MTNDDSKINVPAHTSGVADPTSPQIINDGQAIDYEKYTEVKSKLLTLKTEKYKIFISHASVGEDSYKESEEKSEENFVKKLYQKLELHYPSRIYLNTMTSDYSDAVHLIAARNSEYGVFIISFRYLNNRFDYESKLKVPGHSILNQEYQAFVDKEKRHIGRTIQIVFALTKQAYEEKKPFSGFFIDVNDYLDKQTKDPFGTLDVISAKIVEYIEKNDKLSKNL